MAKFRLPPEVGTRKIVIRQDGGVVVLRFNKKREAKCADKHADVVKRLCPNLELIIEEFE